MQQLDCEEQIARRDAEAETLIKSMIDSELRRLKEVPSWYTHFDDRQRRLIHNCRSYVLDDPGGLPGHQLIIIVSKLADLLDDDGAKLRKLGG